MNENNIMNNFDWFNKVASTITVVLDDEDKLEFGLDYNRPDDSDLRHCLITNNSIQYDYINPYMIDENTKIFFGTIIPRSRLKAISFDIHSEDEEVYGGRCAILTHLNDNQYYIREVQDIEKYCESLRNGKMSDNE